MKPHNKFGLLMFLIGLVGVIGVIVTPRPQETFDRVLIMILLFAMQGLVLVGTALFLIETE